MAPLFDDMYSSESDTGYHVRKFHEDNEKVEKERQEKERSKSGKVQ